MPEDKALFIHAAQRRQMTLIAGLFVLLLVLDAATTFLALTFYGAVELNPLGPVVSVLGKAVAIVVMLGLIRAAHPAWRVRLAAPGALALLLPVMWNVSQLTGVLRH